METATGEARRAGAGRSAPALAALLLGTLLLFSDVLGGRLLFYGDFHGAFEPLRAALGRAWREGLPLWNPSLGSGQPLLASPFAQALYPPNLLFALRAVATARTLTLLAVAHVLWGALGSWLVCRRRGLGPAGSFLGGAVFAWCGASVSTTYLVVLGFTAAWIPWLLLAHESVREEGGRGRGRRIAGLAAVFALMLLAGDPFMLASGLLGLLLTSLPRTPGTSAKPRGGIGAGLLRSALGLLCGGLLVLPALLSQNRFVAVTVRRAGFPPEEVFHWSLHPIEAFGILVPEPFGSFARLGPDGFLAPGLFPIHRMPLVPGLYAGLLAFALALLALSERRRGRWALAAWVLLLLSLALGCFVPWNRLLLLVPGFASTRYPVKWLLGAALPFALLAAHGAEALAGEARRRFLGISLACLLLPAVLSIAVLAGLGEALAPILAGPDAGVRPGALAPHLRSSLLSSAALAAAPLLLAAFLAFAAREGRGAPRLQALVAALAGFDLLVASRGLAPTVGREFYEAPPAAVRAIRDDPGEHGRVWVDASPESTGVKSRVPRGATLLAEAVRLRRERLDDYTAAAYGLTLAFNDDLEALSALPYARLKRLVETLPNRERRMLLSSAAVTHVVTLVDRGDAGLRPVLRIDVGADRPLLVFHNPGALPRVRHVPSALAYSDSDFENVLRRLPEDFFARSVLVDAADLPGSAPGRTFVPAAGEAGGAPAGLAEIVEERGGVLRVRTSGPAGFLVVSDAWVPGWSARVDGRSAPLVRADLAFRLVPVPAGSHVVEMRYDPLR